MDVKTFMMPVLSALGVFGHKGGGGKGSGDPGLNAAASILGMTADALMQQLSSGKSIDSLAQAKGLDPAAVHAAMDAANKAAVTASTRSSGINLDPSSYAGTPAFNPNAGMYGPASSSSGSSSARSYSASDLNRLSGGPALQYAA